MSEISSQEGSWVEPSSRRALFYRVWRPASPSHLLVVIHGFGEHSGRYQRVAQGLAGEGLCVAAPDLWGHGRSGGRRGDIASVGQCEHDCRAMTEQAFLPMVGQRSYSVLGHSFGGLVAIQWALANPQGLRRVVIQSPLLEAAFPIPRWKVLAAHLLAGCWPTFPFRMNLDVNALSHDPGTVSAYQNDPLVHNAMSARSYMAILQARDDALARAHTMKVPTLLLTGAADRIVSLECAQRWFKLLPCEKQNRTFPGCYHELHHEAVFDDVVRLVREWTVGNG